MIVASQAQAQAPDLNAIPDKMPFNIPYGPTISVERAQAVIAAGIAEAKKRGWEMNIAVVDQHGDLKAFARMDEAQLASISIAEHKARTAARYRRETRLFEDVVMKGVAYIPTLDDVIASRGGIPLVDEGKTHRCGRLLRRHRLPGRGDLQGRRGSNQQIIQDYARLSRTDKSTRAAGRRPRCVVAQARRQNSQFEIFAPSAGFCV